MAIDTISQMHPKLALPVYTEIVSPQSNTYEVGEIYDRRIEDSERAMERDQEGPYNYIHDALLISKRKINIDEVPNILLAFDKDTEYRNEALEKIHTVNGEVLILVFLRIDKAKGMVLEGLESVHKNMRKESVEDTKERENR